MRTRIHRKAGGQLLFSRSRGGRFIALTVAALTSVFAHTRSEASTPHQPAPAFVRPPIDVPKGFTIEVAAAPPLVRYPMLACFDDRGRLFIAESDGQNLEHDELERQRSRFVRMLEDLDGDGVFDRSTIFADKMIMPEGALWHDGALYIVSAPYLWRLEDTDGDGVADVREKLVGHMTYDGRPNQHGPYLGPNGRLYFAGGTFGYDLVGSDGRRAGRGSSAGIFSCRLDGTDVRIECHSGINPVEVTFTPEGEALGTCAIFDTINGRHDALVHWMYGGTYVQPRNPVLKQTGQLLPALSRWGQVAPSGVMRYRGSHLGQELQGDLFTCLFNTHRVVRTRIRREGATFRSEDEDFLVSPSIDFHPTDVLEDADGSLLVIDTGGWVVWGCPTSKIAKPNVMGAIYRIRKVGGAKVKDPRGGELDWAQAKPAAIVAWLDDTRPAVRDRAIATLVNQSSKAVPPLREVLRTAGNTRLRRNAVWTLSRIGTHDAQVALRLGLADKDASVRQAAVRSIGTLRDVQALPQLRRFVVSDTPPIRREAATALGQIGRSTAVPALLESLRTSTDAFMEHALVYALIEIDAFAVTTAGLMDSAPAVRRATLIALNEMTTGELTREMVAPLLDTDDLDLQETVLQIIGERPGWADEIVGLLANRLAVASPDRSRAAMTRGVVLAFAGDAKVQALVAQTLRRVETPTVTRLLLLEAMGRTELKPLPPLWVDCLTACLSDADPELRRQTVATLAALDAHELDPELTLLARDGTTPTRLRVGAWTILARHGVTVDDDSFQLLVTQIRSVIPPLDRLAAAESLGSANLNEAQLSAVARLTGQAGPLALPLLVRAFESASQRHGVRESANVQLGLQLVSGLLESPGTTALPLKRVQGILKRYPPAVLAAAKPLMARWHTDTKVQRARLAELEPRLVHGDARRGQGVFFSNQAACSACHRVGARGGQVGPDLSKIGEIRTSRDLLEAILFPSSTIVNGYETYSVITQSGLTVAGVISQETASAIYLRTAQQAEIRIDRTEIDEITPSRLSVMPQGVDQSMTVEQLCDVVAFLQTLK